jgi:hypothetical protein
MSVFNKPAEDIQGLLIRLNKTDVASFGDRAAEATAALTQARAMVEMMLAQAQAAEAKEAELKRLQDEETARAAAAERAEREQAEAAARAEREAAEKAANEQREQERAQFEAEQVAAQRTMIRTLRMQDNADELLELLVEARQYVTNDGLMGRIDALVKHIEGA